MANAMKEMKLLSLKTEYLETSVAQTTAMYEDRYEDAILGLDKLRELADKILALQSK